MNAEPIEEMAVVDAEHSTDEEEVLAVIEDNPYTSGTQYTYVRVPASNGQFITNEI